MQNKSIIGKLGEDLACNYLVKKGYQIINRNYRLKIGEIDIVAKNKNKILIFIEVKTMKQSGNPAIAELSPEDNLTKSKLKRLSRTCEFFLMEKPELLDEKRGWRIDLIAVSLNEELNATFRHYENIF